MPVFTLVMLDEDGQSLTALTEQLTPEQLKRCMVLVGEVFEEGQFQQIGSVMLAGIACVNEASEQPASKHRFEVIKGGAAARGAGESESAN